MQLTKTLQYSSRKYIGVVWAEMNRWLIMGGRQSRHAPPDAPYLIHSSHPLHFTMGLHGHRHRHRHRHTGTVGMVSRHHQPSLLTPYSLLLTSHEGALSSKSTGTEPVAPESMLPTLLPRPENGLKEAARVLVLPDEDEDEDGRATVRRAVLFSSVIRVPCSVLVRA